MDSRTRPFKPPASRAYCTYFDSAYLARGIVLLLSLRRFDPDARIIVLALDDRCAKVLHERFAGSIRIIETKELHEAFPVLRTIRQQRNIWESYMTQTPHFALYAMQSEPQPEAVVYIDSDIWLFDNPAPLYEEVGDASVAFSSHRFQDPSKHLGIYGKYNAGFVYWRNDETGRRCLAEWQDDCLKWCGEEPQPDGRFVNQGYLNSWPERYAGVRILRHPGANLAPWNIDGHVLARRGEKITVDGEPLLFYHFSGLNLDAEGRWYSFYPHPERQRALARDVIYGPYIRALQAENRRLQKAHGISTGTNRSISKFPAAIMFDV